MSTTKSTAQLAAEARFRENQIAEARARRHGAPNTAAAAPARGTRAVPNAAALDAAIKYADSVVSDAAFEAGHAALLKQQGIVPAATQRASAAPATAGDTTDDAFEAAHAAFLRQQGITPPTSHR